MEECDASTADFTVPDADYLLTLDADSLVLPDYALKLVEIMEQDRTIAVAQTPYSAIPDSRNRLERAAGAQTDLQYIVHQGFTAFNATFWVGANALLRVAALRDIRTTAYEDGNVIPVYIQDRTVIEDTGSTIDLVRRGWRLHNHPGASCVQCHAPDFGSLIIQRRRWSNGGLIIFPDLLRYARKQGRPWAFATELLMQPISCSPGYGGCQRFASPAPATRQQPRESVGRRDSAALLRAVRARPSLRVIGGGSCTVVATHSASCCCRSTWRGSCARSSKC